MTVKLKILTAVLCLALGHVTAASAQVTVIYKIYKWVAIAGTVGAGEQILVYSTLDKAKADEYINNHPGLTMHTNDKMLSDLERFKRENLPPSSLIQIPHD